MKQTPKRRFRIDAETLPDLPGMMLVIISALRDLGGSATNQELDEKVIELEGVTEAEQAYTMASNENQPRVNYYLAWSRIFVGQYWAGRIAYVAAGPIPSIKPTCMLLNL